MSRKSVQWFCDNHMQKTNKEGARRRKRRCNQAMTGAEIAFSAASASRGASRTCSPRWPPFI
jgi:hypothetical protein